MQVGIGQTETQVDLAEALFRYPARRSVYKTPFRLGTRARARCSGTKMDAVQAGQYLEPRTTRKKVLTVVKSATNLELVLQQLVSKWIQRTLAKTRFRLVPGHGAWVRPLELVSNFVLGHQQKAMFRLVPRAPSLNGALGPVQTSCFCCAELNCN